MELIDEFFVQWTHVLWNEFLVDSQAVLQDMCLRQGVDVC